MGFFDGIPIRQNGQTVHAGWWNIIREYLIAWGGVDAIGLTVFTLPNNQASPLSVTDMVFSSATARGASVNYEVSRKTDTALSEIRSIGKLSLAYRVQTAAWEILNQDENGDDSGVTFSITAAGQVQVLTTNIAGSNYLGTLQFRGDTYNA